MITEAIRSREAGGRYSTSSKKRMPPLAVSRKPRRDLLLTTSRASPRNCWENSLGFSEKLWQATVTKGTGESAGAVLFLYRYIQWANLFLPTPMDPWSRV